MDYWLNSVKIWLSVSNCADIIVTISKIRVKPNCAKTFVNPFELQNSIKSLHLYIYTYTLPHYWWPWMNLVSIIELTQLFINGKQWNNLSLLLLLPNITSIFFYKSEILNTGFNNNTGCRKKGKKNICIDDVSFWLFLVFHVMVGRW